MSTPSLKPLDFGSVSPYAPKWVREQAVAEPPPASDDDGEVALPTGIETDHDAKILDEIESSLREMIAASHSTNAEPLRLSDVTRKAAEHIAQEHPVELGVTQPLEEEPAVEYEPAVAESPVAEMAFRQTQRSDDRADHGVMDSVFDDPRVPPWLLPRSLEPSPVPEPWPRPRKRGSLNALFVRYGLAATAAAVLAILVVKDIPSLAYEKLRGPLSDLSSNAATVFNEGKAPSLQARMDAVQKEQERAPAPGLQYAVASVAPQPQDQRPVAKTDTLSKAAPSEPRRETVMASRWPTPPEPAGRTAEPVRQSAAPRAVQTVAVQPTPAQNEPTTTAVAPPRALSGEEIAMLRKMGDDYIASGDFVGARAVLERAADAGDASGAFALAATYDPVVLARFKVRGLEPDIVKAGFWYERARELGSVEAPRRLQAMMARGN